MSEKCGDPLICELCAIQKQVACVVWFIAVLTIYIGIFDVSGFVTWEVCMINSEAYYFLLNAWVDVVQQLENVIVVDISYVAFIIC